jgi:peptide/nickel transport system substrate-binding protein
MHTDFRTSIVTGLVLIATLVGCAAPPARTDTAQAPNPAPGTTPVGPQRMVIGIAGELPVLNLKVIRSVQSFTAPGGAEVEDLLTDGLSDLDDDGLPQAKLAEAVPTLENGLWKLLPEGRMETTWKIRETARWHDGTPVTADDLLFTMALGRDRELPIFREATFDLIEDVRAVDARTLTVTWAQPFVQADTLFSKDLAQPLPKHLLEAAYLADKTSFNQLPFWTSELVGAGPFRLKSYTPGSGLVLAAFDGYALGRPKLDEIEIRFIPDVNTLVANLYAGAVDATMGRGVSLDLALQAKEQWTAGKPIFGEDTWIPIFPQFIDPSPAAVGDLRVRRALLHAIDRQQMVDTIQSGVTSVAHSFIKPGHPEFPNGDPFVVKYDYDLRRTAQLLTEAGFTRGADGFYRDGTGQRFAVEIWASGESKPMTAVADAWRQAGIDASPVVLPTQRWNDRQYVSNFPGFRMSRNPNSIANLRYYQSARTPLPENNYVGVNYSRYMNADLDTLIDRYFTTIPKAERARTMGDIMRHMTEVLNVMGLYYDVQSTLVPNRITGMTSPQTGWNAHAWEAR